MYLFRFFRDFWLIVPILIPFYNSFALTNTQIFTIQAVFSLSLFLFEIPSGYFSDRLGRRLTLIIGALALPIGLIFYAFGSSFRAFICGEAILGFGFAMCSGTESALIYDTLLKTKKRALYHKIEGFAEFITRLGSTTASFLGGILALIIFRLPFYINILTGIIMFLVALTFVEPGRQRKSKLHPLQDILNIVGDSLRHPEILSIIIFYAAMTATGLISVWGYLIFLKEHNFPLVLNGLWFAVFQLCSGFGAILSHKLSKTIGRTNSYLILLIVPVVFIIFGIMDYSWLSFLAFFNSFIWGFSLPFFLEEVNKLITSDIRATVLSTGSMAGRILFVILSPIFGFLADKISLNSSFIFLASVFLLLYIKNFLKIKELLTTG